MDRECSTHDGVYGLTRLIVIQEHSHVYFADFVRHVHWCESLSCHEDGCGCTFGVIGGFRSPCATGLGSLSLSLAPVKDCEGLFRELSGMRPSATALNHLVETLGSAWEVVQEGALDATRAEEGVPEGAVSVAVSIDGAMLGMRKEKVPSGSEDTPRPAGFREASSGTVSLYDADGDCPVNVCYGRMPEAGMVSPKEDVFAEVSQALQLRPDLEFVFIADGAATNWAWCE